MDVPSDPVRLLILADDPLARSGLVALLAAQPAVLLVGEGGLQEDLATLKDEAQPDILLVDLGWDPTTEAGLLESFARLGLPFVAMLADPEAAVSAWAAGARGLLPREADPDSVAAALAAVGQGWAVLDPMLAAQLVRHGAEESAPLEQELTHRELEVLHLLAEGLPNKGIAVRLGISEHTAKFHVNAILRKLGAQSRTDAVVRATRRGLILL